MTGRTSCVKKLNKNIKGFITIPMPYFTQLVLNCKNKLWEKIHEKTHEFELPVILI
jgi:hypothetical protein